MRTWIVVLLGILAVNLIVGLAGCSSQPPAPEELTKLKENNPAKTGDAKAEKSQ